MKKMKNKTRISKKILVMTEQIKMVISAIQKAGVNVMEFFRRAAQNAKKKFRLEIEATKFGRVVTDGAERHFGYKVPEPVLALAKTICQPATQEPQPA